MQLRLVSARYDEAADVGSAVGIDAGGHRVEFIAPWRTLKPHQARTSSGEPVELEVQDWQIVARDGEPRSELTREERAARAALLVHRMTWTRPA